MKQFSAVVLGLFLLGMTSAFGQISPTPTDHKVTTDKILWQHGYTSAGDESDDEKIDSVTVGSTMPYFIMPDPLFNTVYFAGASYSATDLTESKFTWTVSTPANGSVTMQNPNDNSTSPWVKIKWNITGLVDVSMTEEQGAGCESDPVPIPVRVIKKPEIRFGEISSERAVTECVTDFSTHTYDFPVEALSGGVISESSDVIVTYNVKFDPLNGDPSSSQPNLTANVSGGASFTLDNSVLNAHGTYTIVITKVTDRTSRKCTFEGGESEFLLGGDDVETFVYTMLPKPQPGKAYHVPNI
ncbi:MAG: hypothetical protein LBL04_05305 [Bacteroidales bacterium]|jgi:hypothetical protein|nr:hypothetical protein [Bacteroidales bacterium]